MVTMATSQRLRKDPVCIMMFNLTLADFGICVCGYPLVTSSNYAKRWLFGDVGGTLYAFSTFSLSLVTFNVFVVISIFRYATVCRPDKSKCLNHVLYLLLVTGHFLQGWVGWCSNRGAGKMNRPATAGVGAKKWTGQKRGAAKNR